MLSRTEGNRIRNGIENPENPAQDEIEEIHRPILEWARKQIPFIPVIYHRPDKKSGLKKGVHDLTVFYKSHAICIEGKTERGKLRTDQLAWILAMEKQGFKVEVLRSAERFFDIIKWIDSL